MNLIGCVPRILKKYGGWILTGLGCAGVIGTAVLAAEEAPKAKKELEEEAYWKVHHLVDIYMDNAEKNGKDPESWTDDERAEMYDLAEKEALPLSFWEKLEIALPIYLPSILTGGLTIGCMIGAQIFNVKQQAALVAAYAVLGQEFAEYRKAIVAEHGEEADRKAMEVARAETKRIREELEKMKKEHGPFLYTIACLPGIVFESTPKDIYEALYHFIRNMDLGDGSVANLYEMIGLPSALWNDLEWKDTSAGDYGWDPYENEVTYGSSAECFTIDKIGQKGGKPIFLIDCSIPPYKLGLDYGSTESSIDHIYEWYCPEEAKRLALAVTDDDVVQFDPPEHYIMSWF